MHKNPVKRIIGASQDLQKRCHFMGNGNPPCIRNCKVTSKLGSSWLLSVPAIEQCTDGHQCFHLCPSVSSGDCCYFPSSQILVVRPLLVEIRIDHPTLCLALQFPDYQM